MISRDSNFGNANIHLFQRHLQIYDKYVIKVNKKKSVIFKLIIQKFQKFNICIMMEKSCKTKDLRLFPTIISSVAESWIYKDSPGNRILSRRSRESVIPLIESSA